MWNPPIGAQVASALLAFSISGLLGFSDLGAGEPRVLLGHTDAVYDVEFSPNGELLASGSYDDSIKLWRVPDGELVGTLQEHTDQVYRVAFSPDGQRLVSCSGDSSAVVWNVKRMAKVSTLAGHGDPMIDVAFTQDGDAIATAGSHIQFWRGETEVWSTPHSELYFSLAFSPDGSQLACGTRNQIHFFESNGGRSISQLSAGKGMVYQLEYSPCGKWLASASSEGRIMLWDVANQSLIASTDADAYALFTIEFSSDGQQLVSAGRERVIRTWSVPGLDMIGERYGPEETILSVSFSPDKKHLACGTYDGKIYLWNARLCP